MKSIPFNFLSIPKISYKKSKFIILPLPYDATVTGNSGTRFAPFSIIYSSRNLELYDEEIDMEIFKEGIKTEDEIECVFSSPEKMVKKIEREAEKHIKKGKFLIGIGGEHSITIGLYRAYKKIFNEINYISFDAHADMREEYNGTRFSHACVSKRVFEEGKNIYVLGVRSISKEEVEFVKKEKRVKIYYAYQMKKEDWCEKIINEILPGKYYLSIDVDFFDPSLISETGTPEPNGFFWNETLDFLKKLILKKDVEICGFDVVELAPKEIMTHSSVICAKLIYKIIGYIVCKWKKIVF